MDPRTQSKVAPKYHGPQHSTTQYPHSTVALPYKGPKIQWPHKTVAPLNSGITEQLPHSIVQCSAPTAQWPHGPPHQWRNSAVKWPPTLTLAPNYGAPIMTPQDDFLSRQWKEIVLQGVGKTDKFLPHIFHRTPSLPNCKS